MQQMDNLQTNQLTYPIDMIIDRENKTSGKIIISDIDCSRLTMDKNGSLYVSDVEKHEVRRWERGEKDNKQIS
jgi:hypothetical protein